MDEVLVRENKPNEWKSLTGVPRTFKNLVNGMGVSKDDNGAFIVKVYNQNEDLVVDCLNPRYGVIDRYVYGSKSLLDLCLQKIVVMVGKLNVPVNEVLILCLGDMTSSRVKKNKTGEYTLVIE